MFVTFLCRKYETPREKILPLPLTKLVQLFKSEQFFKLLGDLTKLELTPSQNSKWHSLYYIVSSVSQFFLLQIVIKLPE